jgi:hypothetical protein
MLFLNINFKSIPSLKPINDKKKEREHYTDSQFV